MDEGPELPLIVNDPELLRLITASLLRDNKEQAKTAQKILSRQMSVQFVMRIVRLIIHPDTPPNAKGDIFEFLKKTTTRLLKTADDISSILYLLVECILDETNKHNKQNLWLYWRILVTECKQERKVNKDLEKHLQDLLPKLKGVKSLDGYFFLFQQLKMEKNSQEDLILLECLNESFFSLIFDFEEKIMNLPLQNYHEVNEFFLQKGKALIQYLLSHINQYGYLSPFFQNFIIKTNFKNPLFLFSRGTLILSHVPPCWFSSQEGMKMGPFYQCGSEMCMLALKLKHHLLLAIQDRFTGQKAALKQAVSAFQTFNLTTNKLQYLQFISACFRIVMSYGDNIASILNRKSQIIFYSGVFLLCVTTPAEISMSQTFPQEFLNRTDSYFEGQHSFDRTKDIKNDISFYFRETSLQNFIRDGIILLKNAISARLTNSEQQIIKLYSPWPFYKLSNQSKIQGLLLAIALYLECDGFQTLRENQERVIDFITNYFETLKDIESPIIILRFLRLLVQIQIPKYFQYVFQYVLRQIQKGKVIAISGTRVLLQYLKEDEDEEQNYEKKKMGQKIMQYMQKNLERLIMIIEITSPMWYYVRGVALNLHANKRRSAIQMISNKLKAQFGKQMVHFSENKLKCCYNFQKVMMNETDPEIYLILLQDLYDCYNHMSMCPNRIQQEYSLMNLISGVIERCQKLIPVIPLILATIKRLPFIEENSLIFRVYNRLITEMTLAHKKIPVFYNAFIKEIKTRVADNQKSKEVIKFYAHLICQLLLIRSELILQDEGLLGLFYTLKNAPRKCKQCIIGILFTYCYAQPKEFAQFLRKYPICRAYLSNIVRIKMSNRLFSKIWSLAYFKLLQLGLTAALDEKVLDQFFSHLNNLRKPSGVFNLSKQWQQTNQSGLETFQHPFNKVQEVAVFTKWWKQAKDTIDPSSSIFTKLQKGIDALQQGRQRRNSDQGPMKILDTSL